jgi:4-carboxymuconolactone decarboxylase
MSDDAFARGLAIRKEVLGDEHVGRAQSNTSSFDADFQRFITEVAWGGVWARPGLDRRARHLITLAMLAALDKHDELAMHIAATVRTGVTVEELKEVFLQVAIYAGVPSANAAFALAKRLLAEGSDPLVGPSQGSDPSPRESAP